MSAEFDTILIVSDFVQRFDANNFDVIQYGNSTTPYVIRLSEELLEPFSIAIQTCASIESRQVI